MLEMTAAPNLLGASNGLHDHEVKRTIGPIDVFTDQFWTLSRSQSHTSLFQPTPHHNIGTLLQNEALWLSKYGAPITRRGSRLLTYDI